jgi:uncharacterized protein (TIGR02996 family)
MNSDGSTNHDAENDHVFNLDGHGVDDETPIEDVPRAAIPLPESKAARNLRELLEADAPAEPEIKNMTEEEALLHAICTHPDDDTPRLVYADWLQEHGNEERAEFIRVQCQLDLNPQDEALQTREGELINRYGQEWQRESENNGVEVCGGFQRGFQSRLRVVKIDENMIKSIVEVIGRMPIHSLDFACSNVSPDQFGMLVNAPALTRINDLTLSKDIMDEHLAHLARMPQLEHLWLTNCGSINDESLRYLQPLNALRTLDIQLTNITNAGVARALEDPGFLPRIERIIPYSEYSGGPTKQALLRRAQ